MAGPGGIPSSPHHNRGPLGGKVPVMGPGGAPMAGTRFAPRAQGPRAVDIAGLREQGMPGVPQMDCIFVIVDYQVRYSGGYTLDNVYTISSLWITWVNITDGLMLGLDEC